jgi:aarF domain-containing kinase
MRIPGWLSPIQSAPWVCRTCQLKPKFPITKLNRQYSRVWPHVPVRPRKSRRALIAGTGILATSGFFLADDARHYLEAVERSSRVVVTLYTCINE